MIKIFWSHNSAIFSYCMAICRASEPIMAANPECLGYCQPQLKTCILSFTAFGNMRRFLIPQSGRRRIESVYMRKAWADSESALPQEQQSVFHYSLLHRSSFLAIQIIESGLYFQYSSSKRFIKQYQTPTFGQRNIITASTYTRYRIST